MQVRAAHLGRELWRENDILANRFDTNGREDSTRPSLAASRMASEHLGLLEFISAEKEKLRQEREELALDKFRLEKRKQQHQELVRRPPSHGEGSTSHRRPPTGAPASQHGTTSVPRPPSAAAAAAQTRSTPAKQTATVKPSIQTRAEADGTVGNSLQLGEYDHKKKQYKDQRHQDYQKHLAEEKKAAKRPPSGAGGKRPGSQQRTRDRLRNPTPQLHPEKHRNDDRTTRQPDTAGGGSLHLEERERNTRKELEERKVEYAAFLREQGRQQQQKQQQRSAGLGDGGLLLRDHSSAKERLKQERRRDYLDHMKSLDSSSQPGQQLPPPPHRQPSSARESDAPYFGREDAQDKLRRQREDDYNSYVRAQHVGEDRSRTRPHDSRIPEPQLNYAGARQREYLPLEDLDYLHRLRHDSIPIHSPLPPPSDLRDVHDLRYSTDPLRREPFYRNGSHELFPPSLPSAYPPLKDSWTENSYRRQLSPIRRQVHFNDDRTIPERSLGSAALKYRAYSAPSDRHPVTGQTGVPATTNYRPSSRPSYGDLGLPPERPPFSPIYKVEPLGPLLSYGGDGSEPRMDPRNEPRMAGRMGHPSTPQSGQRQAPSNAGGRRSRHSPLPVDDAGIKTSIRMVGLPGDHGGRTPRDKKEAYREELRRQMEEKKEKEGSARRKRDREEQEHEAANAVYDPWGKSGAGAPNRDRTGRVVADLRKMRTKNEEGPSSPQPPSLSERARSRTGFDLDGPLLRADALLNSPPGGRVDSRTELTGSVAATQSITGRGRSTTGKSGCEYRDFLRQQIEEKAEVKRKEEEKQKLEDERELVRIEEEKRRLQEEYERELARQKEKDDQAKKENKVLSMGREARRQSLSPTLQDQQDKPRRRTRTPRQQDRDSPVGTWQPPARGHSPPVPAVRKLLAGGLGDDDTAQPSPRKATPQASPRKPTKANITSPPSPTYQRHERRIDSPPVPALRHTAAASPPSHRRYQRDAASPPVPALRNPKRGNTPRELSRPDTSRRERPRSRQDSASRIDSAFAVYHPRGSPDHAYSPERFAGNAVDPKGALTDVGHQLAELRREMDMENHRLNQRIKVSERTFAALSDVNVSHRRQLAQESRRQERVVRSTDPEHIFNTKVLKRKPHVVCLKDPTKIRPTDLPLTQAPGGGGDVMSLAKETAEFNHLKYKKDGTLNGRDELKSQYPEPPSSADSVDRQQKSLLRHQHEDIEKFQKDLLSAPGAKGNVNRRFPEVDVTSSLSYHEGGIDGILDDNVSMVVETDFVPVQGSEAREKPPEILEAARQRSALRQYSAAGGQRSADDWLYDGHDDGHYDQQQYHPYHPPPPEVDANAGSFADEWSISNGSLDPDVLAKNNEERLRRLQQAEEGLLNYSTNAADILDEFVSRRPPLDRGPSPATSLRAETMFRPSSTSTLD